MTYDEFLKSVTESPNPGSNYDERHEPSGRVIIELDGAWSLAQVRDVLVPYLEFWIARGEESFDGITEDP